MWLSKQVWSGGEEGKLLNMLDRNYVLPTYVRWPTGRMNLILIVIQTQNQIQVMELL